MWSYHCKNHGAFSKNNFFSIAMCEKNKGFVKKLIFGNFHFKPLKNKSRSTQRICDERDLFFKGLKWKFSKINFFTDKNFLKKKQILANFSDKL